MKFSVLNKRTIQCIMTEAEFADYGMDKKALFQNDSRVQDFFRKVMQQAEQRTGFHKEDGNVAVYASFLADESLAITFSVGSGSGQYVEKNKSGAHEPAVISNVILKSRSLWNMVRFCEQSVLVPQASLYKYHGVYFLLADIHSYGAYESAVLFTLADEYLDAVCYTDSIAAFIREHGKCMIPGSAMELLGVKALRA